MFKKYSRIDNQVPKKGTACIVLINTRDNVNIPSFAFYNPDDVERPWVFPDVSEYGYSAYYNNRGDGIVGFMEVDGIDLNIIPTSYEISTPGFKLDDE